MSSGAAPSYADLQQQKKAALDIYAQIQEKLNKTNVVEGAVDIHHPERSPGWPVYRFQEFPKMLYHPVKLDPAREGQRMGVRRRNESNPTYAPLDVPHPLPLVLIVNTAAEEKAAEAKGFVKTPPVLRPDLLPGELPKPQASFQTLSVDTILELSMMKKDELLTHAANVYGVTLPAEATRAEIINACAASPAREMEGVR